MDMVNRVLEGDCTKLLKILPSESVDLVVTDPPYFVRYRDRAGRTIANDVDPASVIDAFTDVYRVLKPNTFCISFYGWNRVDAFFRAWRRAGFHPVWSGTRTMHRAPGSCGHATNKPICSRRVDRTGRRSRSMMFAVGSTPGTCGIRPRRTSASCSRSSRRSRSRATSYSIPSPVLAALSSRRPRPAGGTWGLSWSGSIAS